MPQESQSPSESSPKFPTRDGWRLHLSPDSYACALLIVGAVAAIGGVVSLSLGLAHSSGAVRLGELSRQLIVGAWTFLPPLWFWLEWIWVDQKRLQSRGEFLKYRQELNRNMWLALITVLVVLFELTDLVP